MSEEIRNVPYVAVMTVWVEVPTRSTSKTLMDTLNKKCNVEMKRRPGLMPIGSPYPLLNTLCRDLVWQAVDIQEDDNE